jgi:hypothetical protein
MNRTCTTLILAAIAWRSFGQSGETVLPSDTRRAVAVANLVAGFNAIGQHAAKLRQAMKPGDAEAFEAVMEDVMSALMALPGISVRNPHNPETITPDQARPNRIAQLAPDLAGLEKFFGRLARTSGAPGGRKMFCQAQQNIKKMLAALPASLPTVDIQTLRGSRGER